MIQKQIRLDFGLVYRAILLLLVFFIPVTLVHELGHVLACNSEGAQSQLQVSWTGMGNTLCIGTLSNPFLYEFSGGALASAISAIPLLFWRKIPAYVKIISVSFAVGQGFNAIIESTAYSSYITQTEMWSVVTGLFDMVLFVGLAFYFARKI